MVHLLRLRTPGILYVPITWDPVNIGNGITLTNGNLTGESIGAEDLSSVRSTIALATGRDYYWEVYADGVANGNYVIGIVNSTKDLNDWVGSGTGDGVGINPSGSIYWNGGNNGTITDTWTTGDVICVHYKRTDETIRFRINGGAWSAFTSVSAFFSGDTMYAAANGGVTGNIYTARFAISSWMQNPPADVYTIDGTFYEPPLVNSLINNMVRFARRTYPSQFKTITIPNPHNTDSVTAFWLPTAIDVAEIRSAVRGSSTPSATFTIYSGNDRTGVGKVPIATVACSNTTGGNTLTTFTNSTIAANSFVWVDVTSTSGVVNELHITLRF